MWENVLTLSLDRNGWSFGESIIEEKVQSEGRIRAVVKKDYLTVDARVMTLLASWKVRVFTYRLLE